MYHGCVILNTLYLASNQLVYLCSTGKENKQTISFLKLPKPWASPACREEKPQQIETQFRLYEMKLSE